jgi:twinkle protein
MLDVDEIAGVKEFVYFKDIKEQIFDHLDGKNLLNAETTRWPEYDQCFKWLRGETTGMGGIPNMGKSQWFMFLSSLKMKHDGWKVAIYSPESTPAMYFYANYLHTLSGFEVIKRRKITKAQVSEYGEVLNNQLYLCDPEKLPSFKGILERFTKAYEYHGCDMFALDPFNCLEREWETSKRDDQYVGDFLEHYKHFAVKTNTCCVVIIHPNSRVTLEKNGLDYQCPNAYNMAGGAMWFNKLDNLMFIHRPFFRSDKDNATVMIKHEKIKKRMIVGEGGDFDCQFDALRNTYFKNNQIITQYYEPQTDDGIPF